MYNIKYDSLFAQIIETEEYFRNENGIHTFLGLAEKRKALLIPPKTIYMYYPRRGDSLNVRYRGKENAVLIKSGFFIRIREVIILCFRLCNI